MKRVRVTIGGTASLGLLVAALGVLPAPSACACGEAVPGTAAWHWDEMTMKERAVYRVTGHVPFDGKGYRM